MLPVNPERPLSKWMLCFQIRIRARAIWNSFRLEFKVLVMTFKALNRLGPRYLMERFSLYMPAQDLRCVGGDLICVPTTLYMGLPLKMVRKLQFVQNAAARLITGTGRFEHIRPILAHLHWLPIRFWLQFKVLVMTFKALNSLGPRYVKERLSLYMPARDLRSVGGALLRIPPTQFIHCGGLSLLWHPDYEMPSP